MRRALLALTLLAASVSTAAFSGCGGSGGGDGGASPTPSGSPSLTPPASPSPSPTSPTGNLLAHVTCAGSGCFTGRLRTVVFDCADGSTNLLVSSSGTVTLIDTTSVTVSLPDLPAPELDCLHSILDDTAGNTAVSNSDPMVMVVNGTTEDVVIIINDPAM